jgi:transposase
MQINGGEVLVGVDVSKAWLDVCRSGVGHVERIANTPEAIVAWIARTGPTLAAMEPTGGYERALCLALAEAGVRYVKLHPNTILAFRKARGLRAKTDRIDAMLIAQYLTDASARGISPTQARAARCPQPSTPTSGCGRSRLAAGSLSRPDRPNFAASILRAIPSFAKAWPRSLRR